MGPRPAYSLTVRSRAGFVKQREPLLLPLQYQGGENLCFTEWGVLNGIMHLKALENRRVCEKSRTIFSLSCSHLAITAPFPLACNAHRGDYSRRLMLWPTFPVMNVIMLLYFLLWSVYHIHGRMYTTMNVYILKNNYTMKSCAYTN